MALLYPDEIVYGYLRPLYTPYRTGLGDPTVLPVEDDILWDSFLGGVKDMSFKIVEDWQQPQVFNLGWTKREWKTNLTIYVMQIYSESGKPGYLKEFSKFLEKYLVVTPMPSALTSAGLIEMKPIQFQLQQGTSAGGFISASANIQNPESDIWTLAVSVATKYYQSANAPPT